MSELVVMNKLEGITFQNEYLAESVRKIIECSKNIIANHFQIAYELAGIKKLELYKEAGFESVTDFAEKIFGFSKTSTSLAIKVAERYLIDEGDRIATTFFDTGTDFSFNQLRETLPLSERKVNSLVFERRLRPTMTLKQIREVVQEEKNKGNNQSFGAETQENRGISSESTIDISVSSSSSVSSEESDNPSEEHELKQETPSELPQNDLESTSDSSVVSEYQSPSQSLSTGNSSFSIYQEEEHELKHSDIDFMISRLNELTGDEEEEFPSAPYELRFYNCRKESSESKKVNDIELDELVYSDIVGRLPKELKDCFELLKKEVKRLNHFRHLESEQLNEEIRELKEEIERLSEENFKLLHPVKKKRGRPRKNQ